jgi:hypothetical protein
LPFVDEGAGQFFQPLLAVGALFDVRLYLVAFGIVEFLGEQSPQRFE